MTLNLQIPEVADLRPKITVFGVGGAGCNAVNNMIEKNLDGVDFIVANTDAQALQLSKASTRIQLGEKATEGLGAGAQPTVGALAAEESIETIVDHLAGSHMCFITAGMGGGTGTGAAPIIAQAARELGILTVGVVTKPFQFEGFKRARQADDGVETLQSVVDTLIIIPNQNLFRIANEKTTFTEAFSLADDVLYQGVKGVTDLMVRPGIINLDFADIRVVMDEMGKAMMGTGEAEGEGRAAKAADMAISNPLIDDYINEPIYIGCHNMDSMNQKHRCITEMDVYHFSVFNEVLNIKTLENIVTNATPVAGTKEYDNLYCFYNFNSTICGWCLAM